ncbi:MAG: 16S rRNA (guanine(527)-N(7))-methyltransferase RsmG [Deltaproteobacteria bacterium]|nr:16S rRNA (guanine(527)-N(7))-methyltransferase RsmG [Deltaproteobacteria bacterium]
MITDLDQRAAEFGLELTAHHLNLLSIYLDELESWNKKMNLIGTTSRRRIINELVLDSLIPAPFLHHEKRMLDVGSGGGFPGIPIKIYMPHLQMTLLEANLKKIHFLKHVIRTLGLKNIKVIQGRIEVSGELLHQVGYHIVSARALTNLGQVIMWCASHLVSNGLLITYLGRKAEEELRRYADIIETNALIVFQKIPYVLPGEIKRSIVIFKKIASNSH